jgi:hypothetical protein
VVGEELQSESATSIAETGVDQVHIGRCAMSGLQDGEDGGIWFEGVNVRRGEATAQQIDGAAVIGTDIDAARLGLAAHHQAEVAGKMLTGDNTGRQSVQRKAPMGENAFEQSFQWGLK